MPRTVSHSRPPRCMHASGESDVSVKKALALGMSACGTAAHAHKQLVPRCNITPHCHKHPARPSLCPFTVYGPF